LKRATICTHTHTHTAILLQAMIKMFQHVPVLDLLQGSVTLVTPVAPDASVETPPVPAVWRRASHWPVTPIAPVLPDTPVTPPRPVLPGKPGKPRQSSAHKLQRPVLPPRVRTEDGDGHSRQHTTREVGCCQWGTCSCTCQGQGSCTQSWTSISL
jgi:hypothetical protein